VAKFSKEKRLEEHSGNSIADNCVECGKVDPPTERSKKKTVEWIVRRVHVLVPSVLRIESPEIEESTICMYKV